MKTSDCIAINIYDNGINKAIIEVDTAFSREDNDLQEGIVEDRMDIDIVK